MKDAHLAFPLLAGLDFLRAAGAILDLTQNRYGLETEEGYMYYPFYNTRMPPEIAAMSSGETRLLTTTVSLYYTSNLGNTTHSPSTSRCSSQSRGAAKSDGCLAACYLQDPGEDRFRKHKIILSDEVPIKF